MKNLNFFKFLFFPILVCNFSFASSTNICLDLNRASSKPLFVNKRPNLELGVMYGSQLVYNYPYKNSIQAAGLTLKYSTDYFFSEGKKINPFIKLTWIRAGLGYAFHGHPFLFATPFNIGIGTGIKLKNQNSIDISLNGGLAFVGYTDFPGVEGFITPVIIPEVKYRREKIAIATEITFRKSLEPLEKSSFVSNILPNQTYYHYAYYGINITLPL